MARIVWILVAAALLGGVAYRIDQAKTANAKPPPTVEQSVLVRVAKVQRGDLSDRVTLTGTIRPKNEVDVFPKLGGRIETLTVKVGDVVKAGQVLATVEHKEISWQARAAEAALSVARANVDGAKLNLDRTQQLFEGGSAPQASLDGAKVQYALAQAQAAQTEASVGLAKQQEDNARITAPFAGAIVKRPVNLGAMVGPQSSLMTLQDVATLKLEGAVDAATWARLATGKPAEVSVDSVPGAKFSGKVSVLSPSLDAQTRRAAVEVEVDNHEGKLLPNMFARVEVTAGQLAATVWVPREAVLEAAGGAVVFRVSGDHVEAVKPVFGAEDHGRIQVISGLNDGDEVATSGLGQLSEGMRIKVAPAQTGA